MTDEKFGLSRRKLLGTMGVIGGSAALGGAGTMAFFSDEENFENNQLTAGSLDMKAAYSAHYSDWSPDEGEGVNVRMWDGAPNTTGTADDLESDETGLPANDAWLIAVDDPEQFLANTQTGSDGNVDSCAEGTDADDLEQPVIDLDDVKPGDFGEVTFDFRLCDNPGYVWLRGALLSEAENGVTEPEGQDQDEEPGVVELPDVVKAAYWVDDGNNYQNGTESPAFVGSLREALEALSTGSGALLKGDIPAEDGGGMGGHCFSADTIHSVAFAWWVPVDHGNEIQTDSVTFDLGFYTEQCRHNDGSGMLPDPIPASVGSGDFSQISYEKALSMQALSRAGSGRGEIQIHGDSSGVENTTLWGSNTGDTFPANTDVPFTAEVDPTAETASLTINGVTVTDDDVTDGDANGASTGDPEWPGGVPNEVDIAVTASSGKSSVDTVVKDVTVNGIDVDPNTITAQDDLTHLDITGFPTDSTVTVEGTLRFEGSTGDFDGTIFVGIDWR